MNLQTDLLIDPPFGDSTGTTTLDDQDVAAFREYIYSHYGEHGRLFPWRETSDPYEILVSEIMLQQTQTERVLQKYSSFLIRYPDFAALSEATLASVFDVWRGLGYNRRAKALLDIARVVIGELGGALPNTLSGLVALPMIGHATAAAILAFAFGKATPYVETNIRRVFIYFFFAGRREVRDREILPLVDSTLDRESPRQWYYALMDYGAHMKHMKSAGLNPNQRSAHYSRQGAFEGSDRQIRGRILQHLSNSLQSTSAVLCADLPFSNDRVLKCLNVLESEGFLVREDAVYRIGD